MARGAAGPFLLLVAAFAAAEPAGPALRAAQQAGRTVLLQFESQDCEPCRRQSEALDLLLRADGPFPGVVRLRVDLAADKALAQGLRAQEPLALILFQGKSEIERSSGLLSEVQLRAFLEKASRRGHGRPFPRPARRLDPSP